jgi:hypothetical protein
VGRFNEGILMLDEIFDFKAVVFLWVAYFKVSNFSVNLIYWNNTGTQHCLH